MGCEQNSGGGADEDRGFADVVFESVLALDDDLGAHDVSARVGDSDQEVERIQSPRQLDGEAVADAAVEIEVQQRGAPAACVAHRYTQRDGLLRRYDWGRRESRDPDVGAATARRRDRVDADRQRPQRFDPGATVSGRFVAVADQKQRLLTSLRIQSESLVDRSRDVGCRDIVRPLELGRRGALFGRRKDRR